MKLSDKRDVWVSAFKRHVPAHRIPTSALPVEGDHATYQIACPPYLITGGQVITRGQAAGVQAFACLRCFPQVAAPAAAPPPVKVAGAF